MKRFLTLFLALFLVSTSFSAFGCAKKDESVTILRVCNCEDYIDETLLEDFEEEYPDIKVVYSTYGTNENLYNELVINPNSYDLVVPSEYMIEKLAVEGRIQKLDFTNSTVNLDKNYLYDYSSNVSAYIQDRLDGIIIDSNGTKLSDFMVGYMWGTMGWVYNRDNVSDLDVKNWDSPFKNPALNQKITIKDAVRDSYLVGLAMVYQNELKNAQNNESITQILNRTSQVDIDKVGEKLSSLKSMLYGFEVDSGKNDIVLGRIDAYVAWSGDAAYAIDVAAGEVEDEDGSFIEGDSIRDLSYSIPEEGSNIWFDGFVMPSGSTNYDAVYKFLEFISRPESVYRNMNYTGYTSMIVNGDFETEDENGQTYSTNLYDEVVIGWFDEEDGQLIDLSYLYGAPDGTYTVTVSDENFGRFIAQYPTKEIVARCAVMSYFDNDTLMNINDMWEGVKGETFPTWFIILIVAVVVLLAVIVVLYRNKSLIKWLKLPEFKNDKMERKGYKKIKTENL